MAFMKFGNWKITDKAIEWAGQGFHRFVIEKSLLLETINAEDSYGKLYKWIVLAIEEDWLTDDELYDLNFAFVFAAGASQQDLDYQIFDRTMEYQYDTLDEEDETQP